MLLWSGKENSVSIWRKYETTCRILYLNRGERKIIVQLFEEFQRNDMEYRKPNERIYSFLNRSGHSEYEQTRRVLESWFGDIPEAYQKALRTSFCAGDRQHLGAFFEIYCHALLKKQGFLVDLQQVVDQTYGNPIDFLVRAEDLPLFYLEATVASDSDKSFTSHEQVNQLWKALNDLKGSSFQIILEIHHEASHLPFRKICNEIHQWLSTLDPNEASRTKDLLGPDSRPRCSWKQDGWHIDFIAIPRPLEERNQEDETVLYTFSSHGKWSETQNSLSRKLDEKAKKYGTLQLPYIIAVDVLALDSMGRDLNEVFFGQDLMLIDPDSGAMTQTRSTFHPGRPSRENGFWIGQGGRLRNQQVSAVLLVDELMPWSFARKTPLLWHNPWAEKPLNFDIWPGPQMLLNEEKSEWLRHEGQSECRLP
jgi:hypothetical protein